MLKVIDKYQNICKLFLRGCYIVSCTLFLTSPTFAAPNWEHFADDIEITRIAIWPQSVISPELFFVRTGLKSHRLGVIRASDFGLRNDNVKNLSIRAKSVFAINANFFDEHGRALGLTLSRGIKHKNIHFGGGTLTGILQVTQNGVSIINRSDFNQHLVLEALQAGPRLIVNGAAVQKIKDLTTYSRRSGVCIDREQRVVFYISSGLMGISLQQVQDTLLSKEIGCVDALNLDGGGSAQLYLSKHPSSDSVGKIEEVSIQGRDNIPVALGLFKKQ
ncbi:MAG: phosphodiester glycosidase family protein [Bdellovibrionota bacterium]